MSREDAGKRKIGLSEKLLIAFLLVPGTLVFVMSDWLINRSLWFAPLVLLAVAAMIVVGKRLRMRTRGEGDERIKQLIAWAYRYRLVIAILVGMAIVTALFDAATPSGSADCEYSWTFCILPP